ncbi:DUF1090 domain-containing protein [Photobacterium halotolerans]|uniref:DUF1090 domain-containing protein n=1 Tax=Photobacterium halotolerans TaxID=265726 RepID=UPI00061978AB|nr:DUF1090 domain-containing protein [Photobacterium halotolerans]
MLKKIIGFSFLATIATFPSLAQESLRGCDAKAYEIQQQIEYAKNNDNTHRVAGLEKALQAVRDHCTDEGLMRDRLAKVNEKEQEVAERTLELKDAQESGRADKIEKRMNKLKEAEAELAAARSELDK